MSRERLKNHTGVRGELLASERAISMKKNYLYLEKLSISERIIHTGKSYQYQKGYQYERISINKNCQHRKM